MIPVYEIGKHTFEYKGRVISKEEFEDIQDRYLRDVDRKVGYYMDNQWGVQQFSYEYREKKKYKGVDVTEGEGYYLHDTSTILKNSDGTDVDDDLFKKHMKDEDMFILIVDINPDKIDGDSESELRFWMEDSDRVLKDNTIDDKMKLKSLPKAHFCIDTSLGLSKFGGCKLIEMYKVKNHPYKFAILVEKMTLIKNYKNCF